MAADGKDLEVGGAVNSGLAIWPVTIATWDARLILAQRSTSRNRRPYPMAPAWTVFSSWQSAAS